MIGQLIGHVMDLWFGHPPWCHLVVTRWRGGRGGLGGLGGGRLMWYYTGGGKDERVNCIYMVLYRRNV